VTTHQVTYQGPASLAVRAATLLADADGIELTSAAPPEHPDGSDAVVRLAVTLEGSDGDVAAALESVRLALPADATVSLDQPG
jgi:hypothetical protein